VSMSMILLPLSLCFLFSILGRVLRLSIQFNFDALSVVFKIYLVNQSKIIVSMIF